MVTTKWRRKGASEDLPHRTETKVLLAMLNGGGGGTQWFEVV